jgi:hypothetical protein
MKKLILFLILSLTAAAAFAARDASRPPSLQKTASYTDLWMNANRMHGIMRNNGTWFYNTLSPNAGGLWWPRGTQNMTIYAAGQMVGALVNGQPRIAGVIHDATEFQPGMILDAGQEPPVGDNRLDSKYHWYCLRSDGSGDWDSWPVDQGAPVDKEGKPLLIGDQTAFCVYNDAGEHTLFGTPKLGLEIRQLVWAFNRSDVIGDMIFMKWQLVNKSANDWDETIFVIWSDPDVGDGWDDYVGCDSTKGLAYAYNADNDDQTYGAAPPAVGVDFFQGPIIDSPGDTVRLPNGAVLLDKKMLKMTSFIFYNNNDSPQGEPQNGQDIWNYMRGYWKDGTPITFGGRGTDPTAPPTKFMFSGDPETNSGWNDTETSDRRFMMATGPYKMERWQDTNGNGQPDFGEPGVQEIVAGILCGRGTNNFNSVSYVKAIDDIAQLAYDIDFALPSPPKAPVLQVAESSNKVVLSWDERSEFMSDGITPYSITDIVADGLVGQHTVVDGEYTEVTDGSYDFTGYTLYQFSDASGRDPVEYASFGVERLADSTPYSDVRHAVLTVNKHPLVGAIGDPLINGKAYYFGLQANSFCRYAVPQVFSSPRTIVTVVPQNLPGARFAGAEGDTVAVSKSGSSDGKVEVTVLDPSQVTGLYYQVIFHADESWSLVRSADSLFTRADTVLRHQFNQSGNDAYNVVDGLLVKVLGAPNDFLDFLTVANAGGPLDPPEYGAFAFNESGFPHPRTEDRPADRQTVGPGLWGIHTGDNGTRAGYEAFVSRTTRDGAHWSKIIPYDFEMRFTAEGSVALEPNAYTTGDSYGGTVIQIPFELWRVGDSRIADTSDDVRMIPYYIDNTGDGVFNFDGTDHSISGGDNDPQTDWIYWMIPFNDAPGDAGYQAFVQAVTTNLAGYEFMGDCDRVMERMVLVNFNGGSVSDPAFPANVNAQLPETGMVFRIVTSKPNTVADRYRFKAPAVVVSATSQKVDLDKIKVVPNPYYGYHSGEANPFNRWVQFTYMPEKCTIRIFDIVGHLIQKIEKNDQATLVQWDLKNSYGLPVASGIYVYHVEVPGLGEKVGKIALFTPRERLDAY